MGCEDTELIRRWQAGDTAAFEALVRQWQQPVGRFLYHLSARADSVQDLCQEVFLRVHMARSRYRETGAFKTWLFRIALNVARDAIRRSNHEPLENTLVEAGCEQEEVANIVAKAVADLPEPLRVVLVLRHYEEMSFEDIARLTGTPASTIKSRFTAALNRLRVKLEQAGLNSLE